MAKDDASKAAAAFVAVLMHARTSAHMMHLATTSFAEHKALNDFYDGIVGLVDSYAEAYQGIYGIITDYPSGFKAPGKDCVGEIKNVALFVRNVRKTLPQDSELQNIIDEICGLVDSTLYKLRFLK